MSTVLHELLAVWHAAPWWVQTTAWVSACFAIAWPIAVWQVRADERYYYDRYDVAEPNHIDASARG